MNLQKINGKILVALGGAVLAAAAVLYVQVRFDRYRSLLRQRDVVIAKAVEAEAVRLGAARAREVSDRALFDGLSERNKELTERLRAIDKRVVPIASISATAQVSDQIALGPEEHRFTLGPDLKTLFRRQRFHLNVVVVRNVDGVSLANASLTELDPETGRELGQLEIEKTQFQVRHEAVDRGLVQLGAVAGLDAHGDPLAGLRVLESERLHLTSSVVAGYDRSDKRVFGGLVIGYRPFNWNVSFGPGLFCCRDGRLYAGGAALFQLTR